MGAGLNGLDLFSGIGGIALALSPWVKTIAYCEQEPYAQAVLLSRMWGGELDSAPIWDDVNTLRADMLPPIDIITAGFPCQDISTAGRGGGLEGERSGLYWQVYRLAKELQPAFIFLENVPAICGRGGVEVVASLTALGYGCRWGMLSASELGAHHKRERWWMLAHLPNASGETVANTNGQREPQPEGCQRNIGGRLSHGGKYPGSDYWKTEPTVGRVVDGIPHRLDRLRCLGNSVVPLAAREAFMRLAGLGGTP